MKNIYRILTLAVGAAILASCAKWTTAEPLPFKINTIEDTNPELFNAYCESIREYKASEHRVTYAVFDNSAEIASSAYYRAKFLPDSLDFIEFTNAVPSALIQEDIVTLREKFGTKSVIKISFPDLNALAATKYADDPSPMLHVNEMVDSLLKIATEYYDGVTVEYDGMNTQYAFPGEVDFLQTQEAQIFPAVLEWKKNHSDKVIFFEGAPERTVDPRYTPCSGRELACSADYIIVKSHKLKSAPACAYQAAQSEGLLNQNNEATTLKYIFALEAVPDDIADVSTGRFFEGPALELMSNWIVYQAPEQFSKSGIAIFQVQNDCFSVNGYYPNVKKTIKTLNPNS